MSMRRARAAGCGRAWLHAVQLVLVAAIVWGVYRALAPDLGELTRADLLAWRPRPGPLAASLVLLVAVYVSHAFLWRRILRDTGTGRPRAGVTVRVYFLASLGRYLPGKLWQLAGLAVLSRQAGLPAGRAAACAVLGQIAFLTTGLLFLAVLLPEEGGVAAWAGAGLLAAIVAGVWLLVGTSAGRRAREAVRARLGVRVGERVAAALDLAERIRPSDAAVWLVGYGITWIVLGMAFTLLVQSFVPQAADYARAVAGALVASYLAGFMTLIPAGLGIRETALVALLAQVPAVPVAAALVVAVASRVWFTLGELAPLALVPFAGRANPAQAPTVAGTRADGAES
jgi:hypothetical protein